MEAKSKQKNALELPKKNPKIPGAKINSKKIPCGIFRAFSRKH